MATKLTVKVNLTSGPRTEAETPAVQALPAAASPTDFQASLVAVRALEEAARLRARRESRRARAIVAAVIGLGAAGTWGNSLRVRPADGAGPAPAPLVAAIAPRASAPSHDDTHRPDVVATVVAPAAVTTAAPTPAPVAAPATLVAQAATCGEDFSTGRWRAATESCAAAFQQRAEAGLASKAAHALHRRARFAEAGEWAQRALAIDPERAEALVIVAHAESRAGRSAGAARAYRRYLRLAPNGWHADEARRALRVDADTDR